MTNQVRIFGMHKAGTSFLMKALSHFCHSNQIALASSAIGMIPLQAYDKWPRGMSREELYEFLNDRIEGIPLSVYESREDHGQSDGLEARLKRAELFSIGNLSSEKRVNFYRNSCPHVWELDHSEPAIRIIRNPLSMVISACFSHRFSHRVRDSGHKLLWSKLEKQRKVLESVTMDVAMWKTYEFLQSENFFHMTNGPLHTLLAWPDELASLETIRMEDMTASPSSFLVKLWNMLGGELKDLSLVPPEILTFEHQSGGRKQGEIDSHSHMRGGYPNEWRELLPKTLIDQIRRDFSDILKEYYPEAMLGYDAGERILERRALELQDKEALYRDLASLRNEKKSLKLELIDWQGRLSKVLHQRDQIISSHEVRFENMKSQRDKALKAQEAMKASRDESLKGATKRFEDMKTQRDKALTAQQVGNAS